MVALERGDVAEHAVDRELRAAVVGLDGQGERLLEIFRRGLELAEPVVRVADTTQRPSAALCVFVANLYRQRRRERLQRLVGIAESAIRGAEIE